VFIVCCVFTVVRHGVGGESCISRWAVKAKNDRWGRTRCIKYKRLDIGGGHGTVECGTALENGRSQSEMDREGLDMDVKG
jgi:hypothetical protein